MDKTNSTSSPSMTDRGVDWGGLISVLIFYALIALIGVLAAWWRNNRSKNNARIRECSQSELAMVAGRDIGMGVGIFTMIATWVGGGYINGTAEYMYMKGIINVQAPVGYSISLIMGGLFFAKPMRERNYLTMLDPLQQRFGRRVGGLLYIPAFLGELLWSAAILNALGASVSIILDMDRVQSVILSAVVAVGYTFIGGLYSVAFTDVIQLICIAAGLGLCIPYVFTSDRADPNKQFDIWGHIDEPVQYLDKYLLLIMGGIPWQVYFQRVLSCRTSGKAQLLSVIAGIGCLLMLGPPLCIGLAAKAVPDHDPLTIRILADRTLTLPLVIKEMTPPIVGYIGLGAVSAAVMSSSDSSILSVSSMFAHNIFKTVIWQKAPDHVVLWVLRFAEVVCGALACCIGLMVAQVYALFHLCSDLVYVILFPQLVNALFVPFVNSPGVLAGYAIGIIVRLSGGITELGWSTGMPLYIPIRTVAMIATMLTTLAVSKLTQNAYPPRKLIDKVALRHDVEKK